MTTVRDLFSIKALPIGSLNRVRPRLVSSVNNLVDEEALKTNFDLIIIGGGINGSGIARDASERGLKVLLLEKDDFGSGCTSASTRLIHGGLRYLEHFEISLVREALREREILLKNAKHLVKGLEFDIPIYKRDKNGLLKMWLGMVVYDLLSFDKSLPNHTFFRKESFIKHESSLENKDLLGGVTYYDAQVDYPERLCIENILMAVNNGAVVLNHSELVSVNKKSNAINELTFENKLTGKSYKVKGKVVINASGPWIDELCNLTNSGIPRKMGGTKGSHIVVRRFDEGPKNAIYMSAKSDGRQFFVVPWREYFLIGTTDIKFDGDLDRVVADEEEIRYLINETNNFLKHKISKKDVLYHMSGVRPLPYSESVDAGAISRRHFVIDHGKEGLDNLISAYGKLTTYRSLAEETVDLSLKKLGKPKINSITASVPFLRSPSIDIEKYKDSCRKLLQKEFGIDPKITEHLINLYGTDFIDIVQMSVADGDLSSSLSLPAKDIKAQVGYAIENEMGLTIEDILLRRTSLGLSEGLGEGAIPYVAAALKNKFRYSDLEISRQEKQYADRILYKKR